MSRGLKWVSVLTSAGMFFVLLAGALVTNTQSGAGCGKDWPLCNGKFIPAYTLESLIEYSHRAITGVVGLLVVITAIWVWQRFPKRDKARLYAFGALFFTILQAILGAMAVMWDQSSAVMALHFGFSLLAFTCTLLLAIAMFGKEAQGQDLGRGQSQSVGQDLVAGRGQVGGQDLAAGRGLVGGQDLAAGRGLVGGQDLAAGRGEVGGQGLAAGRNQVVGEDQAEKRDQEKLQGLVWSDGRQRVTKPFRNLVWLVTLFTYIVVYIGAFVRHTDSSGGCTGWPLCNGDFLPTLSGATSIVFGHRVAAFLLLCLIGWMTYVVFRDYKQIAELRRSCFATLILVILQVMSGALVVFSQGADAYIFANMLHAIIISGLFGVLCYMSVRVWELYRID